MYELIPALRDSVFSPSFELSEELIEVGIDAVLNNEALKSIPFVGTISAFCKVGYNIRERHLIKQTLLFIRGVNSGTIDSKVLEKHKKDIENNPKKAEKELGRILFLLDTHIEEEQSKILGCFYRSYIKGDISWEKFCELAEANRRMFLIDYKTLRLASTKNGIDIEGDSFYQIDRLISLGLLQTKNKIVGNFWENADSVIEGKKDITVTSFGKAFLQHISKD